MFRRILPRYLLPDEMWATFMQYALSLGSDWLIRPVHA